MQKADFFFKDGMFAQNDKYILKALCEEDKANYLMLYRENSILKKEICFLHSISPSLSTKNQTHLDPVLRLPALLFFLLDP